MLSLNPKNKVLLDVTIASVLVILLGSVLINRGVNAVVSQIISGRCVLHQSSVVQIAQVNIRVLPSSVQYFFNMPVNTDHQQSSNLRILTLNCHSWNTAKRGIGNLLDFYKIGIFCLSETWESDTNPVNFRNWSVFSKSRKDGHGGVAVLCKPADQFMVQRLETFETDGLEAVCIKVVTDTKDTFTIINAYVPPGESDQLKLLTDMVERVKNEYSEVILTGDLNAKFMEWGNTSNNTCGVLLQNCMQSLNLSCVNDDQPTRRESNSIIDLFVVSPLLVRKIIHCQTLAHEQVRSDHISVLLELDCCRDDMIARIFEKRGFV